MSYYLTHHLSQKASLSKTVTSKIRPAHKILDVGSGNGSLKALFPRNHLVGIDILAASVKLSLKAGYNQAKRVNLDKQKLPFISNRFDVIICIQVLEHLYHPLFAVKQIYRILKPNGFFFISVPTRENSKYDDDYTHVRPFTRHSLETLLKDGGFNQVENLYQFRGIPGLGMIEKTFDLDLEKQKQVIADRFHWLSEIVNIEVIARK